MNNIKPAPEPGAACRPHRSTSVAALSAGLALLLAVCTGDAAAITAERGREAVGRVHRSIADNDCQEAIKRLNAGLGDAYPEVQLLAGAMYDNGICVKRNWERASHFYLLAMDGGQKEAVYRLAAGYAAPENGPDIGAALWWASRAGNPVRQKACEVSEAARDDPDRFVAELQAWPQSRLQACNYVTGVMMTVAGEMRYPSKAYGFVMDGVVQLVFHPAIPSIDVKQIAAEERNVYGVVNGDQLRDRRSSTVTKGFEEVGREITARALKRYPQPSGIDPASESKLQIDFGIEYY
jgi:hypothetical protein